jgi:hypothetical protein
MNIEMNYIAMIRNGLRIRYYGGKAIDAIRKTLRRPAAIVGHSKKKDMQRANLERERYTAVTVAQLQSYRFNR